MVEGNRELASAALRGYNSAEAQPEPGGRNVTLRRISMTLIAAAVFCSALVFMPVPGSAGEMRVTNAGGAFNVPVRSIREARFVGIVFQQYDFSCGSAALATLLTYHYNRPVSEKQVFVAMWNAGDQEAIRTKGFSLLDIKKVLEANDLPADGFRVSLDQIADVGVPVIALIDLNGYRHFVVIKGIRDNRVLVGDPAIGLKVWPRDEFEAMWNGIAFAIKAEPEIGKANFNRPEDWSVEEKAPLGTALIRNQYGTVLNIDFAIPGRGEF
jgi:uncharacterized protein